MTRGGTRRLVAVAVAAFAVAAAVPTTDLFDRSVPGDTTLYHTYAAQMVHGRIPYHDFFMEYPPGAIPAFLAAEVAGVHYQHAFQVLALACTLGCLLLAVAIARRLSPDRRRMLVAVSVVALAPLLLGSVLTTHYDAWPALLTALAILLLLDGRRTWSFAALGLGAAAKVYPAVLLPILLVYVFRHRGRREAGRGLAVFVGAILLLVVPFAVVGAGGLRFSFEFETRRPLQIESLGSAFLLAADHLGLTTVHLVSSHNTSNVGGSTARVVAALTSLALLAALVVVWLLFARGGADDESLITASAAALTAYVALGKVLSPQYTVWLLPIVPLVAGTAGLIAAALLVAVLALTQSLLLWHDIGLGPADWVVLARDLLLVGLFVDLVWALRRRPSGAPDASGRSGASPGGARGS